MVLLLTMTLSCSQPEKTKEKSKIIDVAGSVGRGRITDLSEVVSDIKYIPLETSKKSLVGHFKKVYFENDLIYIIDLTDSIKIFDRKGRFVRNFGRQGRGPEEYLSKGQIYILPQTGNIQVNTFDRNVYNYNASGRFLNKVLSPESEKFVSQEPIYLNDTTFFASINYSGVAEFSAIVYNAQSNVKLFIPAPKTFKSEEIAPGINVITSGDIVMYRFRDKMRIMSEGYDTVISVNSKLQIDTPFIFKYGEFQKYSSDWVSHIRGGDGKHITLLGKMMETDKWLFLWYNLRAYAHEPYNATNIIRGKPHTYTTNFAYALFNKEKEEFWFLNQTKKGVIGFRENLMGGPPFWPNNISSDNSLLMVHSAASLLEYAETHTLPPKLAEIVKNLNENDNPVVVIAR